MGLLGAIGFSLALLSLTQIHQCSAQACKILSATSTSASSILIRWEGYPGATSYLLDTRMKNSIDTAPVIVVVSGLVTERTVQGLSPGTEYNVALKVIKFLSVDCVNPRTTGNMLNFTLINTTAVVTNLQPTTNYDCYVYTANQAGLGGRSRVRTITTCEFEVFSNVKYQNLKMNSIFCFSEAVCSSIQIQIYESQC
ncbi:hypothetical protein GOODEAATRI_000590 [Goodea atripinnis]|uniref:Fibronectin type-III domain-containing protein n=1 Tax=Goodea atripinnis TaxID=208336 RepID=A0ABV0NGF6_9TELE